MQNNTSDIQRKIFEFIVNYIRDEGMPPTNREIGKAMNIASTGHVDYYLSMLEKKNLITRVYKGNRSIKLVQQPWGIPIKGVIAAGEPIEPVTEPELLLDVGHGLEQENTYALVVRGHSMIDDHICDGDYVVIKPQNTCEDGDIVVAIHLSPGSNGQATLKRFFQEKEHNQIRLQPANSEMSPIYVSRNEWDSEWRVQGKVVAIFRPAMTTQSEKISAILGVLNDGAKANIAQNSSNFQDKEKSAYETFAELLKSKVADKSGKETLINDYLEHPGAVQDELRHELEQVNADQDEEIVAAAKEAASHMIQVKEDVYTHIVSANHSADEQLHQIVEQCRNEARRWSQYSLGGAILGFLVIMGAIVLAIIKENVSLGFLTALASVIPDVAAYLFFQQREKTNERLERFYKEIVNIASIYKAAEIAFSVSNQNQDHYKELIIKKWLGLHK